MHVLITEDDPETAQTLDRGLLERGHSCVIAMTGQQALDLASDRRFDVIVLDRMLPVMDGLSVLRELRARNVRCPVLILTALGGITDRVDGLEAGADDYLVKPFAIDELAARVNALGRRPFWGSPPTELVAGDLKINLIRREATRADQNVPLQPREFALLEVLMRNAGRIVTRRMFLEQVWGFHFEPETNIVESHLSRLRSKLREGFADDLIETVRGEGYCLVNYD